MQDFGHQQYHAYKFHLQPAFTRFKSESKAHSAIAMVGGERGWSVLKAMAEFVEHSSPSEETPWESAEPERWWMKMFGRNQTPAEVWKRKDININKHDQTSTTTHLFKSLASVVLLFTPWPPCQNHPQQHALTGKSSCAPNFTASFDGDVNWYVCHTSICCICLSHMIPGHKLKKKQSSQSVLDKPHWIKTCPPGN